MRSQAVARDLLRVPGEPFGEPPQYIQYYLSGDEHMSCNEPRWNAVAIAIYFRVKGNQNEYS